MAATYEFTGGYPTPETIRKAYDAPTTAAPEGLFVYFRTYGP
jgi:hypothetical protein